VVAQQILAGEHVDSAPLGGRGRAAALAPWKLDLHSPPPSLETKAERILDLYELRWKGRRLGSDEYVISADERPGVQAQRRCHQSLPAAPGRPPRVEFECRRGGTVAFLAGHDVHPATVFGRCERTTRIVPITALRDQVMSSEPHHSARRVFLVVGNGTQRARDKCVKLAKPAAVPTPRGPTQTAPPPYACGP
jgi:hypothetical protein